MADVEIVLTYVDGAAPGFRALLEHHRLPYTPCQMRSLGELRYVLRSVARHAPWANVTLAVQDQQHVPSWLRRDAVRVVTHREFIPEELLPTFHWATIFMHLWRIPNVCERLIYWSDDTLLTSDRSTEDFFLANGLPARPMEVAPVVPGLERFLGTYQLNLAHTRRLLQRTLPGKPTCFVRPHAPLPIFRPHFQRFYELFMRDAIFADSIRRKSRGDERAQATILPADAYMNWCQIELAGRSNLQRGLACAGAMLGALLQPLVSRLGGTAPDAASFPVVNCVPKMTRTMRRLLRSRAIFRNINDEAYDGRDDGGDHELLSPASQRLLQMTLERLFPEPSRFES